MPRFRVMCFLKLSDKSHVGLLELGIGAGFVFVFGNGFGCLADVTGEEWVEDRWSLSFILEVDGESMGRSIMNGGECIHSPG